MQKNDKELFETMQSLTELTGRDLECVVGTVYATIFIGRIPTREDLSAYLGITKTSISTILRKLADGCVRPVDQSIPLAKWLDGYLPPMSRRPRTRQLIYPVAAKLVSSGFYLESEEEPFKRAVARLYLDSLFRPQRVQTYEAYAGYNILLEYLYSVAEGLNEDIDDYLHGQFETEFEAFLKVEAFLDVIYEDNPHIKIYSTMCDYVVEGFRKIIRQVNISDLGSKEIAKERLKAILKKH